MTIRFHLGVILLFSILASACTNELESTDYGAFWGGGTSPLVISVKDEPISKATGRLSGTSFTDGSNLGVFLTTMDGTPYDNLSYENIKYTAEGEGDGQVWNFDPLTPVMLSGTKGKVYAYYPRQTSGVSLTALPISNDGTDWMYTASPATNVNIVNPSATLTMQHAMTILRVSVVGADANAAGTVSRLTLNGTG